MRTLVTGSSGFVGSHLVHRLLADGHEVWGFDIAEPRHAPTEHLECWHDIRGDIRDTEHLRRTLAEAQPQVVFHLAAQVSVAISMREPRLDIETNVLATAMFAYAAAEAGVRRFVNVASGGTIFGEPDIVPANDDTPFRPRSIYGASKVSAEFYLRIVEAETGLSVASLRPGNIYGPWQDPHGEAGVVAIFIQRMLRGDEVTVFAPGTDTRDYVFVEDIVEAFVRAAEAPEGAMCVVGTGIETSTLQIFEGLATHIGYDRAPIMGPPRPGDLRRIALDSSLALERWGWSPRIDLDEGLRRTVAAFRAEFEAAK